METTTGSTRTIEVCVGPDCSAGGPAILEIEELVMEDGCRFGVISGGCRNLCSMGPNVHHNGHHFMRVKSQDDCARIAKTIGMQLQHDGKDDTTSRVGAMLMKKANRMRWQVLRDVARHRNSAAIAKRKEESWLVDVEDAYRSELGAARMFQDSVGRSQRAERRFERLGAMIGKFVTNEAPK